jgi:hypothetical protein
LLRASRNTELCIARVQKGLTLNSITFMSLRAQKMRRSQGFTFMFSLYF